LTQDNDTDTADAGEVGEDSPVMKAMRSQIKELERALKAAPDRESLAAELRAELARDSAIESELIRFGHPKGILEVVKGKLGDAEVSSEGVAEALKGIGYEVDVDGAASPSDDQSESQSDLARVASLSAEVQSAASGGVPDILTQINQADSREALRKIAADGGFLESS